MKISCACIQNLPQFCFSVWQNYDEMEFQTKYVFTLLSFKKLLHITLSRILYRYGGEIFEKSLRCLVIIFDLLSGEII